MVQFNPYLNMFMVYNQFLSRWTRSAIVQVYFMTISVIFGVNAAMLTFDLSEIGKSDPIVLLGMFGIGLVIVVLIRPWSVLFFYKMLYEPNSRVQSYMIQNQTTTRIPLKENNGEVFGIISNELKNMHSNNSIMTNKKE